jgi:hypothetical protein
MQLGALLGGRGVEMISDALDARRERTLKPLASVVARRQRKRAGRYAKLG